MNVRHFYTLFFPLFSLLAYGNTDIEDNPVEPNKEEILFSVYGNSISTYKGYIPSDYLCWFTEEQMKVEETWWYQVGETMNWTLCNNSSWSGARVSYDADWEYNSYFISPYRISNLSENGTPNYILVLGGVNDWRWSLNKLGNIEDTDSTLFCGAYKLMLKRLQDKYSLSKIFCLSILPIAENGDTIYSINGQGWCIDDANKMIKAICDLKGVSFIDMSKCAFGEDVLSYTADGLHPNVEGMKLLADYVCKKLKEQMDEQSTTIRLASNYEMSQGGEHYNLSGQIVAKGYKGIIISKGKNVIH